MTLVLNIVILLLICLISIYKLNKNYKRFYILFYVYYQGMITSASLTFIESGIYISEQARDSYFVWANLVFFVFFLISIQTLDVVIDFLERKVKVQMPVLKLRDKKLDYRIIVLVGVLVLVLLLTNLIVSPSPLFSSGVTRFTYWENSKLSFLRKVIGNTAIFVPFIFGWIYLRKRKLGVLLLIIYIVYIVLIGQKFSPIMRSLYAFFLPFVLHSSQNFKFNPLKLFRVNFIFIFFALFSLVYIKYAIHNPFRSAGIETPLQAIFYRAFGLQGHLFWGSVEQFLYLGKDKSWDFRELYRGMHTLMRYFWYGDMNHIEASIQNGFSFANAYPAVLLKIVPLPLAYITHLILVASLLAPSAWVLLESVKRNNLLVAFFSFQFFNWTGVAFIMGYFNKTLPGLLLLFLLSVYSLIILK